MKILGYTLTNTSIKVLFYGENGVRKGIGDVYLVCVPPPPPLTKVVPTKTRGTKNDTGRRYKNWGFRRPFATASSCGTVFYDNGFQLSRLCCELSMSVFRGHNHKTTLKPGNTTKIGTSRGFERGENEFQSLVCQEIFHKRGPFLPP